MARAGRLAVGMVAAALLLVAAGCPADPGGVPVDADAGHDGGGGDDAGPDADITGHAGLVFKWVARPAPNGNAGNNVTIKEIRLPLRDVRAIGDSAPGDSRTSVSSLDLRWKEGDTPNPVVFAMAPPGLYSSFEFRVQSESGSSSYQLEGEVMRAGETEAIQFKIGDIVALPVSLPLSGLQLDIGAIRTVEVSVDIMAVMGSVDWANVEVEDGKIDIDENSPEIVGVRSALAASFSLRVITP